MYSSTGQLHYDINEMTGEPKLIVLVDSGISDLYRSFIPKYYRINRQKFSPHISVIRNETIPNMNLWGKYENEQIVFEYDSDIKVGTVYFWLNIFCLRLEEIRKELGLENSSLYTRPPDGFSKCFHCTIANCKSLNEKLSQ